MSSASASIVMLGSFSVMDPEWLRGIRASLTSEQTRQIEIAQRTKFF
jgi:hypothetical protein